MVTPARESADTELVVPTIDCGACARKIKKALVRMEGVRSVDVNVHAKLVRVEYDAHRLDKVQMRDALERAGFPVEDQ